MLVLLSLFACTKDGGDTADTGCEALLTLYTDADGDGFGDDATQVEACEATADQVEQGGDCDDSDAAVNPDGVEVCDGIDNDCDGAPETGASWVDGDGNVSDWTATLTGTAEAPAQVDISTAGQLNVCPGTWYVNMSVTEGLTLVGHGASPSEVVLDGGGLDRVVDIVGDGIGVSLSGVHITGGANPEVFDDEAPSAGGISCLSGAGDSTLSLSGVEVVGNTGYQGGNVATYGCDTTIQDSLLSDAVAAGGGGVALMAGTLSISGSEIRDNVGNDVGGGIMALNEFGGSLTLTLSDTLVTGNSSGELGGGAFLYNTDLTCSSSDGGAHGFVANEAVGGSAIAGLAGDKDESDGGLTVDSQGCDFGDNGASDDNTRSYDLWMAGVQYAAEDDATFSCDGALCTGDVEEVDIIIK